MKRLKIILPGLLVSILLFSACDNDSVNSGMATFEVSMIDAPADYDEVVVDVQNVEVNITGSPNGWTTLNGFQARKIDLLTLCNGNEAYFGKLQIPPGQLREVRMVLGEDNYLRIGDSVIPLAFGSNKHKTIRVTLDAIITAGANYKLIFDFDAGQSIIESQNTEPYRLKPVVRAQMDALTGSISGKIKPQNTKAIVYAILDYDTASTYPNQDGYFKFRSIESGIYQVIVQPTESSGLNPIIIEDVISSVGRETDMGELSFNN